MKLQLIAFTAVVLQSAIPGALSAEPHLRAPSGPKPKKDVSMLISTADAAVAVTADYEEEKARSGALSSAEPHIRAPSGPKAMGDIKVAIPTAMAPKPTETPNCCVDEGCYCRGEGHFDLNEASENERSWGWGGGGKPTNKPTNTPTKRNTWGSGSWSNNGPTDWVWNGWGWNEAVGF